ncbi:kinase-like domain-containing protein [Aspergillus karnatakaensis]|uniref:kinase-like domain-containing protein n=1 Tax=Aspergillus karnatakaensis TaxID=1810916 RepID=UPI003CCE0685
MSKLSPWARSALRKTPAQPLEFATSGFKVIKQSEIIEEEHLIDFQKGHYYPVYIGDTYAFKYQVIGKLGFGSKSTAWLARDLVAHKYSTLKIYNCAEGHRKELDTYKLLDKASQRHPGHLHIRKALDGFTLGRKGPGNDHRCFIHTPASGSFRDLLSRSPIHRLTEEQLKAGLKQVLLALDYLHTECKLIHTDIKPQNILLEITDPTILVNFTTAELETPSPRKIAGGMTVYVSRSFDQPRSYGRAVLSGFGAAVGGNKIQNHDAQSSIYRSPEIMLQAEWGYPVDIWNVGVMVWDLLEGRRMFYGEEPKSKKYSTRAHLAEVVGLLGRPPLDLLRRGARSSEFFTTGGEWKHKQEVMIPRGVSLETSERFLKGKNKEDFLVFMRKMLQWRPEDRKTARELLDDPWLNKV